MSAASGFGSAALRRSQLLLPLLLLLMLLLLLLLQVVHGRQGKRVHGDGGELQLCSPPHGSMQGMHAWVRLIACMCAPAPAYASECIWACMHLAE